MSSKFHPMTSHFQVTGHFEQLYQNDPKMPLSPTRSNVPHMCVTSIHRSHISLCFTLQPAVFEIQAILRQVHWMTPKWPWTTRSNYPEYVTAVLWSQISVRFVLRPAVFEIPPILRHAPSEPKMTSSPTRSNVPNICITSMLESHISVYFALWPVISRYKIAEILEMYRMTSDWLWNLSSTSSTLNGNTEGPNLGPFCATTIFQYKVLKLEVSKIGKIGNGPNDFKMTLNT